MCRILCSAVALLAILTAACRPAKGPQAVNNAGASGTRPTVLPRSETLYFNGQQFGPVVGWNPYSSSNNNAMATVAQDNARVIMFETPYLYNMLDGKVYPLLADGDYGWNADRSELRFRIKKAAHWSDGTPVTAEDVAYTWASHIRYNTATGAANKDYIEAIEAVDEITVAIKARLDGKGKPVNPLLVASYLSTYYVIQKDWTKRLEKRAGGDAAKFLADAAPDAVYSGPYHKCFADDSKVIYVRDDGYWGRDPSMWGRLPAPKYLAHTIFKDNAASAVALKKGEVDVSQAFNPNIELLWLRDRLPVSTYLPDPPYNIGAGMPTAFYNLNSYGLDRAEVRKAIALAVDYSAIISNAATNQSATFEQVPRSLMNPTANEQALYDHHAVRSLQWKGGDIQGARKLLDAAGIIDSNGDGWREYKGRKLRYTATCPSGWSDWQAAIEVVASAGKKIGIEITTNYPEWSVYQTVVAKSDSPLPEGYDIFMMGTSGAGPAQPYARIRNLLSSEWIGMANNWNGNWGGYRNPEADTLIRAIPGETDPAKQKKIYTDLVKIYLTDVPSFTLMYRPQTFHAVNETVWTNFPHRNDGTNPPVPPLVCTDGWGIACLYNLKLVNP
jgi:peptide/nickel transport system substrate-binding protein